MDAGWTSLPISEQEVAIQDQAIATRNYKKLIIKNPSTMNTCKIFYPQKKTIDYIKSVCKTLAGTIYSTSTTLQQQL